jgi:RNA polymerase sigma-70 factor (ECF subfamily)
VIGPKDRSPAFDEDALDQLSVLRGLSRHLSPDRADADDLVQDAYVNALRASHRFTPGTSLKAWLRAILTNLARNHRRDRSRARVRANEAAIARAAGERAAREPSPEQLLIGSEIGPRLQRALEALPKTLRDAVWLRDVEELSYAEIAHRMRVPVGTVMSRISRGRQLLHQRLIANGSEAER